MQANPPAGFAEFWAAYPKRVGKGAAEKAWRKLKPDLSVALSAIERARNTKQWRRDGGQFIPHPATWLNQRRWEDEAEAACLPAGRAADDDDAWMSEEDREFRKELRRLSAKANAEAWANAEFARRPACSAVATDDIDDAAWEQRMGKMIRTEFLGMPS